MRGDAHWAFDQFRQRSLPAFLSDLKALEAGGFHNDRSCPRVGHCFREIGVTLESIPNVRPPAPTAAADFREFAVLYEAWNNNNGDTPEARERRARAHESLARKRERFAARIGKSLPFLKDQVKWKTMDEIFTSLDSLVKDKVMEGVLNNLTRDLDRFYRNSQKYRT